MSNIQIRDKDGVCCLPENIDCEGICNGTMVAGFSWSSSAICCSRDVSFLLVNES